MKHMLVVAAMLAVSTGLAQAATAPQVWQGELFVTTVTTACAPGAIATVGDYYRSVYRPKLAGTTAAEGLSFVGGRSIYLAFSTSGSGMFSGTASYSGTYISSHDTTGSTTGQTSLVISPLPITSNTGTITVSGTITNFFATAGCNIAFRAAYTPRVD